MLSCYVNLFAPYVDAKVDPVFAAGVSEHSLFSGEYNSEDEVFYKYSNNASGTGISRNQMRVDSSKKAHANGVSFIVLDKIDVNGERRTRAVGA